MRIASVLARIGLAWMFGALIYMNAGHKAKLLQLSPFWLVTGCLSDLLLHLMHLGTDPLSMQGSLVGYIDRSSSWHTTFRRYS